MRDMKTCFNEVESEAETCGVLYCRQFLIESKHTLKNSVLKGRR